MWSHESFVSDDTEVFRVKKSNHSKKIVKQLKKEYKEDLEKSSVFSEPVTNTDGKIRFFHSSVIPSSSFLYLFLFLFSLFIFLFLFLSQCYLYSYSHCVEIVPLFKVSCLLLQLTVTVESNDYSHWWKVAES